MGEWAGMALEMRKALEQGAPNRIRELINANFDLRRRIYAIHPDNIAMVEAARSTGASAKFTGSGGAIVGTYEGEDMFAALEKVPPCGRSDFGGRCISNRRWFPAACCPSAA